MMSDHEALALESNGLLDFLPTPPESTKDTDTELGEKHPNPIFELERRRPDSPVLGYGSPPPEYDEEPSDFEDEVRGIIEREKRASSPGMRMDFDEEDVGMDMDLSGKASAPGPVASCESASFFECPDKDGSDGHGQEAEVV